MVVRDTRKLLTLSMLTSWNYSLQLRIEMADKHRWFRHIPRVRARARVRGTIGVMFYSLLRCSMKKSPV